jgi:site-specific DNA recombinase
MADIRHSIFQTHERMKIKERFRLGKVRKAKEGHIVATEAPYGLTFVVKNGKHGDSDFHQGYYEINEQELPVLKNIFTWADEGSTLRAIVKKLQDLGIPPRKSKRGVWNTSTLSTLLRNKTFIGEGHYGASYAVVPIKPLKAEVYKKIKKTSRRSKPEEEWIIIPTPKVIDEDLFSRVQAQLKSNFDSSIRNTKNPYLLAGNIYCSCGVRRAGEGAQHGKHLYYRCTSRVKNFPLPPTCLEKGINARISDSLVWEEIISLMSSPDMLLKQVENWVSTIHNNGRQNCTIDIEITRKEIQKLKEQEERFAKAYGAGVISVEQLREYTTPVKEKIAVFENQIKKALLEKQQVNQYVLPDSKEIELFAQKAKEKLKNLNFEAKKAIVGTLVEKVVGNTEELVVSGYIPLQYLENHVSFITSHRNCRPAKRGEVDIV